MIQSFVQVDYRICHEHTEFASITSSVQDCEKHARICFACEPSSIIKVQCFFILYIGYEQHILQYNA